MRTTDAQMLVLCALARGPLHGYAVNTAIQRLSGERLGRGSLSGALARLEAKGLIEPLNDPSDDQGRQRPLRLTAPGREELERELHSAARITQRMFEAAVPDRVGYQERLAAMALVRSYRRVMEDALGMEPGQTVLDLGCGPGTALGLLAEAVTWTGSVLGVERDPLLAERARARTADLGWVEVREGEPHRLPVPDGSVDRVWCERVLQHADDPGGVLADVRRVLLPGGRLVAAEPDWESLAIDHPDVDTSRAYTRHIVDRTVRNGLLGRQLARLAADAGFTVGAVHPVTRVLRDAGEADRVLGIQRNAQRAVEAGYISAPAAQRWLDGLAEGPFLAAVTLYVVVAER